MPEIEITESQRDRLEAVQASLEGDIVGKYGHVRPRDALEYLLDRYEADVGAGVGTDVADGPGGGTDVADGPGGGTDVADGPGGGTDVTDGPGGGDAGASAVEVDADDGVNAVGDDAVTSDANDGVNAVGDDAVTSGGDAGTGGDDAVLDAMMNLLDQHEDKWGESSSEARYEVELPDGSVEAARTKDDVRGLLFRHYR